jgi:hypothetical protein
MRAFVLYIVTAVFVTVALVFIAPPELFGVGARPMTQGRMNIQSVNRTQKGDRLFPNAVGKSQPPHNSPNILIGCDPVISPLSASARANYSAHCIT